MSIGQLNAWRWQKKIFSQAAVECPDMFVTEKSHNRLEHFRESLANSRFIANG